MLQQHRSIKTWAHDDRPRLKLASKGKRTLSDSELIAILINSGTREKTAIDLAKEILLSCNNSLVELSKKTIPELCRFKGMGEAKAVSLIAGLELSKRIRVKDKRVKKGITSSQDSYQTFRPLLEGLNHEEFYVLLLNRSNRIIKHALISSGGINQTVVDPRIIFKHAIDSMACSMILAHNHPSGQLKPSDQDVLLTRKIKASAKIMEIELLDHLILTDYGYFSFADSGIL